MRISKWLGPLLTAAALLCAAPPALAAADKPLVSESHVIKTIPANTTLQLNAGASGNASLNCPQGSAPSSPINGDMWCTSAGIYVRIAGVTIGPLSAATVPGGSTGQPQYNNGGVFGGFTFGGDCTFSVPNLTCTKLNGVSPGLFFNGTDAGNLTGTINLARFGTQSAHAFLGGPTSGSPANPTFRQPACADISDATALCSASATNGITNAMLRQSGALSVIGRSANSTGNVADIQATASSNSVLREKSSALQFDSVSNLLDDVFGSAQGTIVYRGASGWTGLGPGTSGKFLKTNGASADPAWAAVAGNNIYEAIAQDKPVTGSFTFTNQGSVTASNGTIGIIFVWPAEATNNLRYMKKAAPAAPYSLYMRVDILATAAPFVQFGLVLGNSTSGRMLYLSDYSNSATEMDVAFQRWSGPGPSPTVANIANAANWTPHKWFRIDVTSTTATPYFSPNGWDWAQFGSAETLSSYVTATGGTVDQIGFGVQANNGSGTAMISDFGTNPPL